MSWHVDDSAMRAYVGNSADPATAFSVEAHVLTCAECRAVVAASFDDARLAAGWTGLRRSVTAPRRSVLERALTAAGVSDETARLLEVTPSLQLSWIAALTMTVAVALALAHLSSPGATWFLIAAPILPLGGTILAYGPHVDPAYEIAAAASRSRFALLMIRTTAVLIVSGVVIGIAAAFLPEVGWRAAGWILPSLALSVDMLALSTRTTFLRAGLTFGVVWVAGVTVLAEAAALDALWEPTAQAAFGGAALIGAVLLFASRHQFETGRIA
ncbi:MAG TPA: zf-HC2 domain-containing protein [Actinomycetota bacterium]|nr:zf-HC2 domain-containing protein [Actinomycetota bacterium]